MTISSILYGMLGQTKRAGLATSVVWGGLTLPLPGWAQTASPSAAAKALTAPQVEGKTIDGTPFKLSSLNCKGKGKVVMVMFCSTGCAVCRDKMPELRTTKAGTASHSNWW